MFPLTVGGSFALIAFVGMTLPVEIIPGVKIDGRILIVGIAGAFYGPVAGLFTGGLVTLIRIFMGGNLVLLGSLGIMGGAGVGILFWYKKWLKSDYPIVPLILLGALLTFQAQIWIPVFFPLEKAMVLLLKIAPVGFLLYPSGALGIGLLISHANLSRRLQDEIIINERKLNQASKLAGIGTLAAGIAHELNNPLSSILGFAERIQAQTKEPQTKERAERIINNSQRMSLIIKSLLQYARKSRRGQLDRVDVNEVINRSLVIYRKQLELENINLYLKLSDHPVFIECNGNELETIFHNMVQNSQDAFKEVMDTRNKELSISLRVIESQVVITIKDNASGMEPERLGQIFDPFYTTKDVGKGTGLGMSITSGIVEKYKGTIQAESALNEGTVVTISFPIAINENKQMTIQGDKPFDSLVESAPSIEKRSILVIEDEEDLLELVQDVLSERFEVTVSHQPKEAMLKMDECSYDLILTDLKMPHMTGLEFIKWSKKKHPNLPIILITGMPEEDSEVQEALKLGVDGLLLKPWSVEDLLVKVQKVLLPRPEKPILLD